MTMIYRRPEVLAERRKAILHNSKIFSTCNSCSYRYKISEHAFKKRVDSKLSRLTISTEAIVDVLSYLVEDKIAYKDLQKHLSCVNYEKKIALIFYNQKKSHLIGILVAFNVSLPDTVVATIITMYDRVPKNQNIQKMLFPNEDRIALYDYDLATFLDAENERLKKKKDTKLKQNLLGTKITKISSADKDRKSISIRKVTQETRKIKKIRRIKKVNTPIALPITFLSRVRKLFVKIIGWFNLP